METQENKSINPTPQGKPSSSFQPDNSGRIFAGLIVILVGGVLLAEKAGADIPNWITSFPMLLIAIGVFIGAKHKFSNWGWMIPTGIGLVLLTDVFLEDVSLAQFIWPAVIIAIGLIMIFKPKRNRDHAWKRWQERRYERFGATTEAAQSIESDEDVIETVTVFGGAKKNIISKNFKGGETVTFFGGAEINLTQADINGRAVLEMVQVFGGTKLVVPSNWKIQTEELVCVFGGLDDKRKNIATPDENKVLVLRGTCVFGGIDIKSY